ncbi:NAD(P)H-dependent oxidoreductase [Devosia sp.]|uniref:NADPH-dependent FMN reductase n=1 Tax=Devosia sp. TaxID=1871048 RepID=UPI001AD31BFF|nr:NAD(P)H-dependent oxidoreductase [Devosia sp.]MBN9333527.1 NAD(P)H-dependent oxidoreductase [Devosia sp.]
MALSLKIIIGSTRPGRVGPTIAKWVEEVARQDSRFDIELVDLADLKLPLLDEATHPVMQKYEHDHTRRWASIIGSADAYIFVTPEYNYFAPAALVNAIQTLLKEWGYKAAGVVSYGGISGGLRSAQALRQLLGNVNVHALPQVVPVPSFPQFIGEDGVFRGNEAMTTGLTGQLDELYKWASALSTLRTEQEAAQKAA